MAAVTYTAAKGLDLTGDELGAWMASTTVETLTNPDTDEDISGENNDLTATGSITKAVVATGAELVGYSGFSSSNYLERAYDASFDYGTAAFFFGGWFKCTSGGIDVMFSRGYYPSSWSGSAIRGYRNVNGTVSFDITDDGYASFDVATSTDTFDDNEWHMVFCVRSGSSIHLYIDGVLQATSTVSNAAGSLSNGNATLRFGNHQPGTSPFNNGPLALWRTGAYAPSAAQIKDIYNNEKILFNPYEVYTQVGQDYSLDIPARATDRSVQSKRNQSIALSGKTETLQHRQDRIWDVESRIIVKNDLSAIRRFLESALNGHEFTFDPYGTVASEDLPVTAVLTPDGYREQRIDTTNNFRVGFQVREIG